jgi:hypothetical protein
MSGTVVSWSKGRGVIALADGSRVDAHYSAWRRHGMAPRASDDVNPVAAGDTVQVELENVGGPVALFWRTA